MTDNTTIFSLRLPRSIKEELSRIAKEDNTSMNQFVVVAIAEKLAVMRTAEFMQERMNLADEEVFDRILNREDSLPPLPGDELPEGYVPVSERPTPS